jgi:hypothetical protein
MTGAHQTEARRRPLRSSLWNKKIVGGSEASLLGFCEGCDDGVLDSWELGTLLGAGDFDGVAESSMLGFCDGCDDGESEKLELGLTDGLGDTKVITWADLRWL